MLLETCSSCGRTVEVGLKFCTVCGQPLTPAEVERTRLVTLDDEAGEAGGAPLRTHPYLLKEDGKKIEIKKDKIIIGREKNCDIHLESLEVSARHARLERAQGGYLLTDLRSTNGTYVNDRPISSTILHEGDVIGIGPEDFQFHEQSQAEDPFMTRPLRVQEPEEEKTELADMPEPPEEPEPAAPEAAGVEAPAQAGEEEAEPPREEARGKAAGPEPVLNPVQVQMLAKKMEKGMPSPIAKSPDLSVILFADEELTWAGQCMSAWYFGPNQRREIYIGVTHLRFIVYYIAPTGSNACQSYWYDVDFGGITWKSGFKTWRGFTVAPPELDKKTIELYPQKIREDGTIKTLFVALPLESLKVPETEDVLGKYQKDPEAFFETLQKSYDNRKPVDPEALLTLLDDPDKAAKMTGTLSS